MKAGPIEFRLRMLINVIIVLLGFYAPWIDLWGIGRRIPVLEWLPWEASRLGWASFAVAAQIVLVAGTLLAAIGAALRIWGAAWLGPETVIHPSMQAGAVLADGPYRYVRNPLYLGLACTFAALALLMPPTGALFVLVAAPIFLGRLILGEEDFLAKRIGEPYRNYLRAAPRLFPRMRTSLKPSGRKPRWLHGAVSEIAPIGVFIAFAFESRSFDLRLMARTIVVFFGIGLIARAIALGGRQQPSLPE